MTRHRHSTLARSGRSASRLAGRGLRLGALTSALLLASFAHAQQAPRQLDIPAQRLDQALNALAAQTGARIVFSTDLTEKHQARALHGQFNTRAALEQLLGGSGLVLRETGEQAYTVAPAQKDSLLGEVRVQASTLNDSTTEGSGSYASSNVAMAKGASLREIPQSITVVTRQQIEDQQLTSVGDVLAHTTGITTTSASGGDVGSIYARGFQVSNMQIDGSSVDAYSNFYFNPNLAMYDHVEVLRGADGLFSGTGEAGGTVNLVRKRALATPQFQGSVSVGSWENYRAEVDVTGPLAFDGKLRGRLVTSYMDRDFHYDTAEDRNQFVYGVLELDLGPRTVLSVGGSYEDRNRRPNWGGLPRNSNGSDLGLSRDTALMPSWAHGSYITSEGFAALEHSFNDDWKVKISGNYMDRNGYEEAGSYSGTPDTGLLTFAGWGYGYESRKTSYDVSLNGAFELFGGKHELVLGMDGQKIAHTQYYSTLVYGGTSPQPITLGSFDPDAVPRPVGSWKYQEWAGYGATQRGLYGKLKLQLAEPLHLVVGGRQADYEYDSPFNMYNASGALTSSTVTHYKENNIVTPYGGLIYDLNEAWTAYGSVAEIYKSQGNRLAGPLPGTQLDPITGRSVEVGIKGELLGGRLNTAFSLYRIEREGEAVQESSNGSNNLGQACCYVAMGKIVSKGLDAEISGELLPRLQIAAGYTYNYNENRQADDVPYSTITPKQLFKLWTSWQLPGDLGKWRVGGGVNAQSSYYVTGSNNYKATQSGYAVWNAFAQYRIDAHWTASLNINNLFDRTYYQTLGTTARSGNWYGEPRNAMLTVRALF